MYLEEIIEDIQLESDKCECKAKLNRDDVVGWLKTIAGFANASGGDFYIGVEDKTNKLIGFDRIAADNERNYFNNQSFSWKYYFGHSIYDGICNTENELFHDKTA